MEKSCLVPIGRITKPHGVRGAVKVFPYGETLSELKAGEVLIFGDSEAVTERHLTLVRIRPQKRILICDFEESRNFDQATQLAGRELLIPAERLPTLPDGQYYHYQLIGLTVETKEGRSLGTLRGILETGGNDVYVVENREKELLIPAIEDVICSVDLLNQKMIVDLPEGLEQNDL